MKRMFINSEIFTKFLDEFIRKRKLLQKDFEEFENELLKDPKKGDVIPGMGGLRKARIKAAREGKAAVTV